METNNSGKWEIDPTSTGKSEAKWNKPTESEAPEPTHDGPTAEDSGKVQGGQDTITAINQGSNQPQACEIGLASTPAIQMENDSGKQVASPVESKPQPPLTQPPNKCIG